MYRYTILVFIFLLGSLPGLAKSSDSAPATYILQITSNLSCSTLSIELVSQQDDTRGFLNYSAGAFASVDLPTGEYIFNDVVCVNGQKSEVLDFLKEKIAPLSLTSGHAYYGGRMIFEQVINEKDKVKDTCTRIMSGARGGSSGQCLLSSNSYTPGAGSRDIKVYVPEQSEADISAVRSALTVTKEQLKHLPIKV